MISTTICWFDWSCMPWTHNDLNQCDKTSKWPTHNNIIIETLDVVGASNLILYSLRSKLKHARVNGKYDFILECCTAPPNDHECDLYIKCHVNDFAASNRKKSFNDTLHFVFLQAICLRHAKKKRLCLGLLLQLQIQHACKFGFRRRLPQKEFQWHLSLACSSSHTNGLRPCNVRTPNIELVI